MKSEKNSLDKDLQLKDISHDCDFIESEGTADTNVILHLLREIQTPLASIDVTVLSDRWLIGDKMPAFFLEFSNNESAASSNTSLTIFPILVVFVCD